jgi:probable F420-dependent oxidoreductase, MSMEG_2516 family
MHPFRFGVINEICHPPKRWLEQVRRIEALGYASFLIRDHLVSDFFGHQYAPIAALSMAASVSERLAIGTLVIDNDFRHPAMLAKEMATLDLFSNGRLELGLGAGWLRNEYDQAGLAYDSAGVRIERLDEAIQIIKGLWSGRAFRFEGKHYRIDGLESLPQPFQSAERTRPRLLLGGGRRRMLQLAGREADTISLLTTSVGSGVLVSEPNERSAQALEEKLSWIKEGAGERFEQIELNIMPSLIISDERRGASDRFLAQQGWSGVSYEALWEMPSVLIGSIDQICDTLIERRERFGISYYVVRDAQFEAFAPVVARLAGK